MLTDHTSHLAQWSKAYHALLGSLPQPKRRNHRQPSSPKPRSTSQTFSMRDVPHLVPNYNPNTTFNALLGKQLRKDIESIVHDNHSFMTPLTSDDLLVILDSGCSIAITPDLTDFLDGTYQIQDKTVTGIGSGLQAKGIGTVQWSLPTSNGGTTTIELQCLHVPEAPC